ncbi:MAG: DUF885 domain-containing protein [Bryobacteraceae bacterium]
MRFISAVVAAAVFALTVWPSEDQAQKLAVNFVYESLALSPTSATAQGYHEHNGIALDEQLDDFSKAGIERARAFYRRSLGISNTGLSPELQADLDVIKLECQSQLFEIERAQSYRHNPAIYVETIGNAIYSPFILNYAPESKRLAQITSRIEKIPAFVEVAKQNLVNAPEIWTRVAQEENQGSLDLIDHTIREKIPADLKARYDQAAANAIRSLNSFNQFLRNDLSRRSSDWRLGPELYAEKFKVTLATGDTPQQALVDAEAKLESIREEMRTEAVAVYPKFFPGETPPQDLNTVVSQVLDKIARQHAVPERYFDDAKRDLAETTQFVKDHKLLSLPAGNNLQVIPTPEFMRGIYGVGGFSPAPVLEPQLGAYYWITPFTPDMTPERVESKLREYNRYGLEILTIHEAMPGHYVQAEYAAAIQPKWRRALRAIFSNGPYVEGWAVYATEMMINGGYDKTPEMELTFGKQMLRVVSNTILDIKLQTMGMTDRQALDLMIKGTFQEREEAEKKLQRAKLSSCQLPTYFAGWRGWDRLRDAYRTKQGPNFSVSTFNERALKEGSLPLPILARILAGNP